MKKEDIFNTESEKILFKIEEKEDFTLISFEVSVLSPKDLMTIKPPEVDGSKGVVLSGHAPVWLYCFFTHYYHPTKFVATHDPHLGGAVVVETHSAKYNVGSVLKEKVRLYCGIKRRKRDAEYYNEVERLNKWYEEITDKIHTDFSSREIEAYNNGDNDEFNRIIIEYNNEMEKICHKYKKREREINNLFLKRHKQMLNDAVFKGNKTNL